MLRARHAILRLWASQILLPTKPFCLARPNYPTLSNLVQIRDMSTAIPDEHRAPMLPQTQGIEVPTLQFPNSTERGPAPLNITKSELQRYIYPLLCYGWKLNTDSTKGLFLTRKMVFKGPVSARKFLKELLDIEESLWHHSTSLHLDGEKRPNLTITIQTHDLEHPWLSVRDANLASSLESIYREKVYGPTKGKSAVQPPCIFDSGKWDELLSMYPWDVERHRIEDNKLITL